MSAANGNSLHSLVGLSGFRCIVADPPWPYSGDGPVGTGGRGAGGTNTPDNIRPICRECNHKRSQQWRGNAMAEQEANLLKQIKILLHGKHTPARTVQGVVGSLESET